MTDERLQRLLARAGDDGRAHAETRAWPVARAAFAQRPPVSRSPGVRRPVVAVAVAAALCLIVALAVTSPGNAVAEWVRDHIIGKPGVKKAAPALTHLPGGGRVVVTSRQGVWVVGGDGSRRLLRGYTGATWSPRGLYLGAWSRHELSAVEPGGRVHWTLARPGPIRGVDWSPDGYRIAYLSGRSLRVVAGDGTGDTLVRTRVAPIAPAWRPNAPHLLALAAHPRSIEVVATDAKALAWRHRLRQAARSLAWSADGRLLAVAGPTTVTILDGGSGRTQAHVPVPPGSRVVALAFAHSGSRLALVLRAPNTASARVLTVNTARAKPKPSQLFAGTGAFSQVQWSPDGNWVLISWPAANQWLFLRAGKMPGVSAVRNIARQFDPGARAPQFPAVSGWCCG
jgi:dipeptidyl aminopeptidase/acylaminoacyl peptidase